MSSLEEIISQPPVAIDEEGTKGWPHPVIEKYAQRYPDLKGYAYWVIEDSVKIKHFVITRDQRYIKTSQSLEEIALFIDLLSRSQLL